MAAGISSFAASGLAAEAARSRQASMQNALAGIEGECRQGGNGDWRKYYDATRPVRMELNRLVVEGFRNPRPSRVRADKLALLPSRGEPLRFTASGDCIHACLFDFQRPDQPQEPEPWVGSIRMVAQIAAVSKWLKSKGADLIVAPVPRVIELYPKSFLLEEVPRPGIIAPHLRYLTAELLRADVEVFDLFPPLKLAAEKGSVPLYLPTDAHWTDPAQRLTAGLLAKLLGRYPFAQEARKASKRYKIQPAEFRFGGYFYEYLTGPELDLTRASMTQVIEEVVTVAGKPFVADAKAPVLVVGDSFTAFSQQAIGREQSGEAVALRKANDPFAEFKPPVGSGIVPYLARELNVPVSHRALLGSTLEPFRDLFRNPDLLGGAQAVVWMLNTTSLFRPDAYTPTFRTPPI